MFYEKSSFGWNSLNTYLNNTSLRCVKIDFDYHLSDEKRDSKNVIYYHKEDDYELHEGLLASPSKFSVRNMEREFLKYVNEDKQVGLVVCAGGIDCLLDVFIELAEKYQWYLHLIYLGEWEGTEVDHKGLLRIIKNADQYDSICFLNRYGMIDYNEKLEDVIAQITAYEELVSEDIAKILLKAQKLHKIQQSHKVNLYNHQKEVYEEIYELEKSSNDVQKQEKNDNIFSNVISANHLMVNAVTNSMSQLGFVISQETRDRVIGLLKSSSDAVSRGLIQESTANYLQKEVFAIKKAILQEWSDYYHRVADQKINMLQTIKGIAPEREKVDYASNKIKQGASWDFKQDNLDKMEKGLQEADEIINSLGFGEDGAEILAFLKKVASGKASVHDLTPDILNWLMENNMTSKLAISFR